MSRGPDDPLAQWDQAIGAAPKKETSAAPRLTLRPHPEAERKRPEALYRFFEGRKISRETVDALGVYAWPWAFPGEVEAGPSLVFPTRVQGREVARTYRHRSGERYDHEHSAEAALYNGDAIEEPDLIVWASQALGVAALMEAGYPQSVAIESGEAEDRRFLALDTHAGLLAQAGKIKLALDDTAEGHALREELARRLGRHRCYLVTWPDGCAGPAATLAHLGPDALREAIEAAEPYPIKGVQVLRQDTLLGLRRRQPPATMTTGCGTADQAVRIPTEGRVIIVTGIPGHGKALALDTLVPTPDGWTTMGMLKAGDRVYAQDGSITEVEHAWPVLHDRPCYRVEFSDGSSVVADAEHLWFTRCEKARRSEHQSKIKRGSRPDDAVRGRDQRHLKTYPSAKTTKQIADTLYDYVSREKHPRVNHSVAVAQPLEGAQAWPLDIPPYTLGAWLGDGTSESGGITSADPQLIDFIRADAFEVRKSQAIHGWYIQGLKPLLRNAGVLGQKHVPDVCLRAPVADRRALLQGLMDTDGFASRDGTAEFCSTNYQLADAVFELAASLGYKPLLYEGRAMLKGRDCGPKFRVCFNSDEHTFRLPRKRDRVRSSARSDARARWRKIVAVEPVPSVPVRCIAVTHPSKTFLVGRTMIPTHNSSWVRFAMVHQMEYFDRKWAVFSPEMEPWEEFVASCAEVFHRKLFWPDPKLPLIPSMTEDEILQATQWFARRLYMLVSDSEDEAPTLDWWLEKVRELVLRYGITDALIDPWNEMDHSRGGLTIAEYISRSLQRLNAFARRHGVNVWIVNHPHSLKPPQRGGKIEAPGIYDMDGGASWANKGALILTVHRPPADESPHTQLLVRKAKFRRLGSRGNMAEMAYDALVGTYSTPTG